MISDSLDRDKFVQDAADEIDSKLGFVYKLPLEPLPLPTHQGLLLKGINNKLASGRLILALDIASEDRALHAYGLRLVTEAQAELMLIANGGVVLTAVGINEDIVEVESKVPTLTNYDSESGVDAFYEHTMRGNPWYWRPGDASSAAF